MVVMWKVALTSSCLRTSSSIHAPWHKSIHQAAPWHRFDLIQQLSGSTLRMWEMVLKFTI